MVSKKEIQTAKTVPSIPAAKRASMVPSHSAATQPAMPATKMPGVYSYVAGRSEWDEDL